MGNTGPAGERRGILGKLRMNTSILDFSAAPKETSRNPVSSNRPSALYSRGPERVLQPRRGRGYGPQGKRAGRLQGGAIPRRPGIG